MDRRQAVVSMIGRARIVMQAVEPIGRPEAVFDFAQRQQKPPSAD